MTAFDVVIPVAWYHHDKIKQVLQTVRDAKGARAVLVIDKNRRGAGWARNQSIPHLTAPYVTFLDADDWLHPDFILHTSPHLTPMRYVYTNWSIGERVVKLPSSVCRGGWRLGEIFRTVTCLVHRAHFEQVRFDEAWTGLEDALFYQQLHGLGIEGVNSQTVSMRYNVADGMRARSCRGTIDYDIYKKRVEAIKMGCCGGKSVKKTAGINTCHEGDVLASCNWQGIQRVQGRSTGRLYRGGNGGTICVDEKDAQADSRFIIQEVIKPSDQPIAPDVQAIEAIISDEGDDVQQVTVVDDDDKTVITQTKTPKRAPRRRKRKAKTDGDEG